MSAWTVMTLVVAAADDLRLLLFLFLSVYSIFPSLFLMLEKDRAWEWSPSMFEISGFC